MKLKYLLFFFLLTLIFAGGLNAQTDLLDSGTNIDDLFGSDTTDASKTDEPEAEPASSGEPAPEKPPEEKPSEDASEEKGTDLVDLVRGSSVSLSGDFSFNIGYTAGYTSVPWIPGGATNTGGGADSAAFSGFTQGALTDTKSSMSLNFRIAPIFRIYLTFKFSFPTFKAEIGEFFADYSFKDVVYMRAGRFTINWGISRYYPFTNLTARLPAAYPVSHPEDYTDPIHDSDSYGLRLSIPVGTGGFDLIGFTRNGFMEDPYHPSKDEIGWGGTYNLAIPAFDFTLGGFYIKQLNPRFFASLKTTLFEKVDAYTETVVSWNTENNDITYGANIGFLYGFIEQQIQLSAEYYYNTETEDLEVKDAEFPLIYGHNIAGGIAYNPKKIKLKTYVRVNYNVNENSGMVIPGFSWSPLPYFTLTTLVPVIFGDPDGTYMQDQPSENDGRTASLVIMAILHGSF